MAIFLKYIGDSKRIMHDQHVYSLCNGRLYEVESEENFYIRLKGIPGTYHFDLFKVVPIYAFACNAIPTVGEQLFGSLLNHSQSIPGCTEHHTSKIQSVTHLFSNIYFVVTENAQYLIQAYKSIEKAQNLAFPKFMKYIGETTKIENTELINGCIYEVTSEESQNGSTLYHIVGVNRALHSDMFTDAPVYLAGSNSIPTLNNGCVCRAFSLYNYTVSSSPVKTSKIQKITSFFDRYYYCYHIATQHSIYVVKVI